MSNNEGAVRTAKENSNEVSQESKNKVLTQTGETLNRVKDKVGEQVGNMQEKSQIVKEKVSDNISVAADKVHQKSDHAQEFLDKRANKISELAHQTIGKVNEFGHRAGDVLNSSSEYVRNFDIEETRQQVKQKITTNPGRSLVIAGVFGLLIGLLIGRTNKTK